MVLDSRSMRASRYRSTVSTKFWQWKRVWKPRIVLPSRPSSSSSRQGQMPNDSGFGHGMCQKMIILHQHDRVVGARLGLDRVGEAPVHAHVLLPVGRAEYRPHVRDVAQRPKTFVGEAVVI